MFEPVLKELLVLFFLHFQYCYCQFWLMAIPFHLGFREQSDLGRVSCGDWLIGCAIKLTVFFVDFQS